jgi:hypothetical protein
MTRLSGVNEVRSSLWLVALPRTALMVTFLVMAVVSDSACQVFSKQTREQCDECCGKSGYDEYYAEQCRLKCFRNHDHCIGVKGVTADKQAPAIEKPQPSAQREQLQQEPQPPRVAPAKPKPQVDKPQLVWPNPLNLAPGREGQAAAHILNLNGIPPQHPNYPMALRSIQDILINFARNNPGGGALPTSQLERIISQMK